MHNPTQTRPVNTTATPRNNNTAQWRYHRADGTRIHVCAQYYRPADLTLIRINHYPATTGDLLDTHFYALTGHHLPR